MLCYLESTCLQELLYLNRDFGSLADGRKLIVAARK